MTSPSHEDYLAAGFGGSLTPGRASALLVIDPMVAYLDPESSLYAGVEDAVVALRELVAGARAASVPVVFTRVEHDPDGLNGGVFFRKVPALGLFAPDSPFSAYIEGLAPERGDLEIVKQYPSAFAHTSLAATLTAMGVDTVFLSGFSTSGCIRASATDAMQNGFVPFVVEDAVGDRLPEVNRANLYDIQAKIGEVVSLGEAVRLMGGTP